MKPFTTAAFVVLLLAGLAHLLRIVIGFDVVIAGQPIPRWVSAIAALIALGIVWQMRKEARS